MAGTVKVADTQAVVIKLTAERDYARDVLREIAFHVPVVLYEQNGRRLVDVEEIFRLKAIAAAAREGDRKDVFVPPTNEEKVRIAKAAKSIDWEQIALNGGPPCFHLDGDRFCLRAKAWPGHKKGKEPDHEFVGIVDFLQGLLP